MGGNVFFNNGDQVPGFGNTDTVPAMLTPGEFVIRKGVAQKDPDGMRALNDGQAMIVPVQGRQLGGVIASLRNKMIAVGASRGVTMSSKGHQRTSGFNAFATPGARPGGFGYSDFSSSRFFRSKAGKEVSRLYGASPLKRVRGADGKIDKKQSEVNIHAVSEEFLNTYGLPKGTASTPDLKGSELIALGATGKIDPDKVYRILPAMSVKGSQDFNEKLNDKTATAADWVKIGPGNLTDLAMHLHHELGLPPAVVNNILSATANRINYKVLSNRGLIDEQDFAKIVFNSAEESIASNFKASTNNWVGMNAGGMVPTMGGAVTSQGGRSIPVPAQNGKYNAGGIVPGMQYFGSNMVGRIVKPLSSSIISRLTSKWKPKKQFYPQGMQYTLGNQDPLHGPLQIGRAMHVGSKSQPDPFEKDPFARTIEIAYNDPKFARMAHVPGFPVGTLEDRGKYILRQYMAGNYGILNTPGATEAVKTLSKKFSGKLYRGIYLKNNKTNPLPAEILELVSQAKLTGDYSPLIGKEFIMRRSSWSQDRGVASLFAPGHSAPGIAGEKAILLEAIVKNRNVVPASEVFPDARFSAPFGQKVSGHNSRSEQESIFGGKFRIVSADNGTLKLETIVDGARAMGGPVNAGRPYLVGENGPELFVPRNAGGIVPGYAKGGNVKPGSRMDPMMAGFGLQMAGQMISGQNASVGNAAMLGGLAMQMSPMLSMFKNVNASAISFTGIISKLKTVAMSAFKAIQG